MTFAIHIGTWLIPAAVTLALFAGWRIWGVRMKPNGGQMFPDAFGAMAEVGGYLVAGLLSVIVWLIWALVA